MSDTVIKLSNVTKTYKLYSNPKARLFESLHPFGKKYHKPFHALKGIDLEVKRGEVLGIVGRNGSGKSTLLKIISGVLAPTTGIVEVKGKVSALLELGSGFNPEFTGMENIYFMGALQGFGPDEMKKKVEEIVDFAEIGDHIDQPVRTYSSGMKARLAFAVSTAIEPEILILDEVLSVGDALFQRKAFERMQGLILAKSTTVLFVSHDLASIVKNCDSAILLIQGNLIEKDEPKVIIDFYQKYIFTPKDQQKTLLRNILAGHEESTLNVDSADISDINITNNKYVRILRNDVLDISGNAINVLYSDQVYHLLIEFEISRDLYEVAFGWLLRDKKGMILSGVTLPSKNRNLIELKKNQKIVISSIFYPLLASNDYFFDIGVTTTKNKERTYLLLKRNAIQVKIISKDSHWGLLEISKNDEIKIEEFI